MLLITQRGNTCEYCGKRVMRSIELTGHHKIEITADNVDDANISLNPDNIMIVHSHPCHDKIHGRFGFGQKEYIRKAPEHNVYIVYGPPMSGKTTYVQEQLGRGDIVVCIDSLYRAIGMLPEHDKPNSLLPIVRGVYNQLLDNVKTRYGKWDNAYVISGLAEKYKREKLAADLGGELIFCNIDKDECLRRLSVDPRGKPGEWENYIEKWFQQYTE